MNYNPNKHQHKPALSSRLLLPLLCLLLLSIPLAGWARSLVIGSLSNSPREEIAKFLPLVEYLAAGLGEQGIDGAKVQVSRTFDEMAGLMIQGKVDLFIDSSMSALIVQRLSHGDFLARRWKRGRKEYCSVIFVHADSPIAALADLAGHTIAFDDPFSSSGYLLPAAEIRHAGLPLVTGKQNQKADSVLYRFAKKDTTTLLQVLNGRADAGAMADYKFTTLSEPVPDELRVIFRSAPIPYHLVVYRPGLPNALRKALLQRLMAMDQEEEGKQVLKTFQNTTRFDPVPARVLQDLRSSKWDSITAGQQ